MLYQGQKEEIGEQQHTLVPFLRENRTPYQGLLDQLVTMTERMAIAEGRTQTIIPFLSLIRHSQPSPLIPSVLSPSFCLILRGAKEVRFGQDILLYHPGNFLASIIDMPAFAQVTGATWQSPYLGLRIDFTTQDIASVMTEARLNVKPGEQKLNTGAFIGKTDVDFLELFVRLLKLLDKPAAVPFLSTLLKREMIFHLLSGDAGPFFFQQVLFDQQAEGVGKAITWIKDHYACSFTVEELAAANNMSVSGLHHKFKAITAMGPLQYQKRLRLQEARRLLLSGAMDATSAALAVGYESPSQFSREYRRLFGLPPLQDVKAVLNHASASAFLRSLGISPDQDE